MSRLQRLVDKFQLTLHALFCLLGQRDSKTQPKISENHSAGNESNRIADTRFLSSKRRDVIKLTSSLSNSAIRSCLETPLALFALLKHQCKRNAFKRNLYHSREIPLDKQGQQIHTLHNPYNKNNTNHKHIKPE